MEEKDIKNNLAINLPTLRKKCKLTQLEIAERLNYSDKAVSKWERGESIPDITILNQLANIYGVTTDFLISSHEEHEIKATKLGNLKQRIKKYYNIFNQPKYYVQVFSILLVWLLATVSFVFCSMFAPGNPYWLAFIFAIPVSSILGIVFSSHYKQRLALFIYISLLCWSLLLALYLTFPNYVDNIWLLFIIGIPIQAIVLAWFILRRPKK